MDYTKLSRDELAKEYSLVLKAYENCKGKACD